ncbi:hypothetical protein GGX14DRAFT_193344 [Mycena pura]|uniref:RING-type domain-containing protein n=1 Tax=Mycena pura TaxID=153505 RepID=A0AAD6VTW1_9AGAR|nr:hypothetical protein GGX14DRAFT_193344 [Mycena pura]
MSESSAIPSSAAFEIKYCSLCDVYFYSMDMLKAHITSSNRHPKCVACKKSFLNNNSLRNHYVLSSRHQYCRICQKHFKTAAGLRIHLDFSHLDSDDEDEDEDEPSTRPDGWEDQLAYEEDLALGGDGEIPISIPPAPSPSPTPSPLSNAGAGYEGVGVLKLRCPICLSSASRRKTMCATRCGHVFCAACIKHVLEETKSCPSCRQPAVTSQLRSLDLHMFRTL